ncbi:retrovirus-related pol polyprotein from transposon TNT 1-94 [Tanacetum coccineum]
MLDKPLYDSWKSIIEIYILKKYVELYASEKLQANCDLKDTKIILQGLPTDVYALVNHHRITKDLWEQDQLLMQVNTKFLNSLPPEWSKFVTDVKLVRDLRTTNFHQLKTYMEQHEIHVNEVRIMRERNQDPLALGRQSLFAAGTSKTRANISGTGGNTLGQQRVMKCFNCQGEGHMARQCPKPKRKRDATRFRDKVLLVEAQGSGKLLKQGITSQEQVGILQFSDKVLLVEAQGSSKVLNKEELEFLADPRVAEGPVTQTVITHNAAYQADDLDAYDYDCDVFSTATIVLMANLSSYGLDVISEVPHSKNTHNDMLNQSVQEMSYSEQTPIQDTNSSAQQDAMILSVFEQLSNQVTNCNKVNKDNVRIKSLLDVV